MSKQATRYRRVQPSRRDMRDMLTTREVSRELRTFPRSFVREV